MKPEEFATRLGKAVQSIDEAKQPAFLTVFAAAMEEAKDLDGAIDAAKTAIDGATEKDLAGLPKSWNEFGGNDAS